MTRFDTAITTTHPLSTPDRYKNWTDNNIWTLEKHWAHLSPKTKQAIQRDLQYFSIWYTQAYEESLQPNQVTPGIVAAYTADMRKTDAAPATINRRMYSLRKWCKVLVETGHIPANPTTACKAERVQPGPPKGLRQSESRRLLREVELRGKQRDMVIVCLMLNAGLRVSEVCALTAADITVKPKSGYMRIRRSKHGKSRTAPLPLRLRQMLAAYIQHHDITDDTPLFTGQRGPLTTTGIHKLVVKYATHARIDATPHTLRHSFAYQYLLRNSGDIMGLAQILGHSNINTTAIYAKKRLADLAQSMEEIT